MTVLTPACPVSVVSVEAEGDGTFALAAQVDLPSQHTILLVRGSGGRQAIRFPDANVGDLVDVFFISGDNSVATARLGIFDADGYTLVQTDAPTGQLQIGTMMTLRKIFAAPYSAPGSDYSNMLGTWIGNTSGVIPNYPPST